MQWKIFQLYLTYISSSEGDLILICGGLTVYVQVTDTISTTWRGEKRVIKHVMEELREQFLPQTRPVCGTVLGRLLLNGKQKFIQAILIPWINACFSCMLLDQPIRKKYFITRCHGVPRPNIYCTCRCTQFKCRCGIFVLSAVCSHRSIHSFFCEVCFCCLITSPHLLFGLFVRLHDSLCLLLW